MECSCCVFFVGECGRWDGDVEMRGRVCGVMVWRLSGSRRGAGEEHGECCIGSGNAISVHETHGWRSCWSLKESLFCRGAFHVRGSLVT